MSISRGPASSHRPPSEKNLAGSGQALFKAPFHPAPKFEFYGLGLLTLLGRHQRLDLGPELGVMPDQLAGQTTIRFGHPLECDAGRFR